MEMKKHCRGASGFTVMELIVTIAIAGVLMGVAVPSFMSLLPTLRLSSAARQVATDLQLARMKAISQNTQNTVTFVSGTYTFTVGSVSRNLNQLYPGITVASVSSNPIFSPRGTTSNGAIVSITLSNGSAQTRVCVKIVGQVSIQDAACS